MVSSSDYVVRAGESDADVIARASAKRRQERAEETAKTSRTVYYAQGGQVYSVAVPRGEDEASAVIQARQQNTTWEYRGQKYGSEQEATAAAQQDTIRNVAQKTGWYGGEYQLASGETSRWEGVPSGTAVYQPSSPVESRNEFASTPLKGSTTEATASGRQYTTLTDEQLKSYGIGSRTSQGSSLAPQTSTASQSGPFLSMMGGTYTEWEPTTKQKVFGAIREKWGEQKDFFLISLGLREPPKGQVVESISLPVGNFGKMLSSARNLPSTIRQIASGAKSKVIESSGIAEAPRALGPTQAAVANWGKTTTAGKMTFRVVKTGAGIVAGTEAAKLGSDVYIRATTPKEDKLLIKKYEPQYKIAQAEAYDKSFSAKLLSKEGAANVVYNIQPLVFEKTGLIKKNPEYKEAMTASLTAQNVPEPEATRLAGLGIRKRESRQAAELPTNVFIESQSELFARMNPYRWVKGGAADTFTQKAGEKLGRFQLRLGWNAFKRQAGGVAVASTMEGAGQYYAQQRLYDQKVTLKGVALSGALGTVSGTIAQGAIQVPALNPKTKWLSRSSRFAVEVAEGGNEFLGDTLATVRQRTARRLTGKPIIEPVIEANYAKSGYGSTATFGFQESPGRARGGALNTVAVNTGQASESKKSGGFFTKVSGLFTTGTARGAGAVSSSKPQDFGLISGGGPSGRFVAPSFTHTKPSTDIKPPQPGPSPFTPSTSPTLGVFEPAVSPPVFNPGITEINPSVSITSTSSSVTIPTYSGVWSGGWPAIAALPSFGMVGSFGGGWGSGGGRKAKYTSSVEAVLLGVESKGKGKRGAYTTGLEMRPL